MEAPAALAPAPTREAALQFPRCVGSSLALVTPTGSQEEEMGPRLGADKGSLKVPSDLC